MRRGAEFCHIYCTNPALLPMNRRYPLIVTSLLAVSAHAAHSHSAPATRKQPVIVAEPDPDNSVDGQVLDDNGQPLPGATVFMKGTYLGTSTDQSGRFHLTVPFEQTPVVLQVSYVGYDTKEVELKTAAHSLSVSLMPSPTQLNETVVSASRVEEQVMRTPVTVEKVSSRQIEQISTPEILGGLGQFKGIDVNAASMLFTSISTRGFNTAKSERVIQLVDYADNQLPSLNLSPGNLVGIPELDMESVEIIHGPASALYGSNALSGVILFNSKDPFVYEGLTARVRGGQRDFLDGQLRYAKRLGRKWAFKVNGSYLTAQDWLAQDYRATRSSANPAGSPLGYDALNRYGDASNTYTSNQPFPGGVSPELEGKTVYMPGFTETETVANDNRTRSYRVGGTVAYLLRDDLKLTLDLRHAAGTSTYQNLSRFRVKGLGTDQLRLELKGSKGFLRAYSTRDFSGGSYELNLLGMYLQNSPTADGSTTYAQQYFATYNGAYKQARADGASPDQALTAAKAAADATQLKATDARYQQLRQGIVHNTLAMQGARLTLDSQLHDVSGQREFAPWGGASLVVGGAYRAYLLGSDGHIFSDRNGKRLHNYEYGGYTQLTQTLLNDHLKLAAAGRVDNFRNFDPAFSPRASAVVSLGTDKQHNFRVNYGTAFRSPSQIEQYTQTDFGYGVLQGNIGNGYQGYALRNDAGQALGTPGVPLSSFELTLDRLKLERVSTFEVGYKGIVLPKLYVDVNYFDSRYRNFIGGTAFVGNPDGTRPTPAQLDAAAQVGYGPGQPTRIVYSYYNNGTVHAHGGSIGAAYYAHRTIHLLANYSLNVLDRKGLPEGFVTFFNTPKHKYNVGVEGQIGQLRYSANYRWVEGHLQEMPFATGTIRSYSTLDAYLGYTLPKLASTVQAGVSNALNNENVQVYGGPAIGRLAYLGLLVDIK